MSFNSVAECATVCCCHCLCIGLCIFISSSLRFYIIFFSFVYNGSQWHDFFFVGDSICVFFLFCHSFCSIYAWHVIADVWMVRLFVLLLYTFMFMYISAVCILNGFFSFFFSTFFLVFCSVVVVTASALQWIERGTYNEWAHETRMDKTR